MFGGPRTPTMAARDDRPLFTWVVCSRDVREANDRARARLGGHTIRPAGHAGRSRRSRAGIALATYLRDEQRRRGTPIALKFRCREVAARPRRAARRDIASRRSPSQRPRSMRSATAAFEGASRSINCTTRRFCSSTRVNPSACPSPLLPSWDRHLGDRCRPSVERCYAPPTVPHLPKVLVARTKPLTMRPFFAISWASRAAGRLWNVSQIRGK